MRMIARDPREMFLALMFPLRNNETRQGKVAVSMKMTVSVCALYSAFAVMPAHADVIDGDWCAADGRSLSIRGAEMRIPSGAEILGEYTRHTARYVGPVGDREAGHDVRMRVSGDDDMWLERVIDGAPQPDEEWHRCKPIS